MFPETILAGAAQPSRKLPIIMPKPPLHHYRFSLPFKAVHIQCLNENGDEIRNANASGFIVNEKDQYFLYTCWHVVTGFDMHDIRIGRCPPNRVSIRVTLQNYEVRQPGVSAIGGNQSIIIPLYRIEGEDRFPIWIQENKDQPHVDLNNVNIKVPSWHDLVKIPLPSDLAVSDMQTLGVGDIFMNSPMIGDKLYIVGFPYGYSALGMQQPTPIVLTRFLAANAVEGRVIDMLMDGPGAPGMSGGPVFVEHNDALYLTGIYTGIIYPDYVVEKNEKTTALGTYCNMIIWWKAEVKLGGTGSKQ
jgi:hypothetical protein